MHHAMRRIVISIIPALVIVLGTQQVAAESPGNGAKTASPGGTQALIERGEQQLERGEHQAAISTLSEAVADDPASSLARTRLGGAYLLTQNYDRAIEQFQQAIGRDDQNAGAFIGLGVAYLHLKQAGPAKAALTEARRLAPDKRDDIDVLLQRIEQTAAAPHH